MEKIRFSYSRLTTYLDCPLKYYYKYHTDVIALPATLPLFFGTSIHAALEQNDIYRKDKGIDRERTELKHIFRTKFLEELKKNPAEVKRLNEFAKKEEITLFQETVDMGEKMIDAYLDHAFIKSDKFVPEHMEKEFDLELSSAPVRIYGFVDIVTKDGIIIDRKTSKNKYPEETAFEKKIQLVMYTIWYRKTHNKKEKRTEYHVLVKNKKPYLQIVPVDVSEYEIQKTIELIKETQNNILAKKFPPKPGWMCNYCDFKSVCTVHNTDALTI